VSFKIGILIGGVCLIYYCLRIGYFPQEVSVGDGFLFIVMAACFGYIYLSFIISLTGLGVTVSPILNKALELIYWAWRKISKHPVEKMPKLAVPNTMSIICSFFAAILILSLGQKNSSAYWILPILSILLCLLYSLYRYSADKLTELKIKIDSPLKSSQHHLPTLLDNAANLRRAQMILLCAIGIAPLLFVQVAGPVLDSAMRLANVRVEKPLIYLRSPYSALLPSRLEANSAQHISDEFKVFENIAVLFRGFGKNTVISYLEGENEKHFEIPNDFIIVIKR
jgi:hypothetical protein